MMTAAEYQQRYGKSKVRFSFGVDPGRDTGVALYDRHAKQLRMCRSMKPVEVEALILAAVDLYKKQGDDYLITIEDTRGRSLPRALQSDPNDGKVRGVGMIHAEMNRWQEFCEFHKLNFRMVFPSKSIKRKVKDDEFKRDTGWEKRSNHNMRDAAYLAMAL